MSVKHEPLQRLREYPVESLARTEALGASGFSEIVPFARRIKHMFCLLTDDAFDETGPELGQQITKLANSVHNLMNRTQSFDSQRSQHHERSEIITGFKNASDQAIALLVPLISLDFIRRAQADDLVGTVQRRIEETIATKAAEIEKLSKECVSVLATARDFVAEYTVAQQAKHFESEAVEHSKMEFRWLIFICFAGVALLGSALGSLLLFRWDELRPETTFESYQLITGKLLLFGVLSYSFYFGIRNFMSHRHNVVINRHRQNALETYRALVAACGDEKAKAVILTQAATCIFAPQETGFTKAPVTPRVPPSNTIVEMIGGRDH